MIDRDEARHLLSYDAWATERLEGALVSATPPATATRLYAHVVGSLETWLERTEGRPVRAGAWWPESDLADLLARRRRISSAWLAYAARLDGIELAREVRFTNSAGIACLDPVEAIVRHVVNHGTHHRAQIAVELRATGVAPPAMDYIVWRRELQRAR